MLFPNGQSLKKHYNEAFLEGYVSKQRWTPVMVPSFSVFKRARHDPLFSNVKEARKHYHGRCDDCSTFRIVLWGAPEYVEQKRLFEEHRKDVLSWRQVC